MNTIYHSNISKVTNMSLTTKIQKNLYFVTKSLYNELISKDFSDQDLLNVLNPFSAKKGHEKLSDLTFKSIKFSSGYIYSKAFDPNCFISKDQYDITPKEGLNIVSELDLYLNNFTYIGEQKYYELKVLDDQSLLVIVNKGFLEFVAKSKINLREFYLDLLRAAYNSGTELDMFLSKYIQLGLYDSHYELLKSKILF